MFEFCGKPSKILTKSSHYHCHILFVCLFVCLFLSFFLSLIEEELIYRLHLRKYIENEIFDSTL